MDRTVYAEGKNLCLCAYIPEEDDRAVYECWRDPETEAGFNFHRTDTFEEYAAHPIRSRWLATITRKSDGTRVRIIFLSPEGSLPDLAILLFAGHRGHGYGTEAFALGADYCFEKFALERLYAGCYESNARSMKMLQKCGFHPHPAGDQQEKHHLTGAQIIQYDFVKLKSGSMENA